jgi:ATP synthase protein I
MADIQLLYPKYKKYMFYLLALLVLGWGFTEYQSIFAGLILGTIISFINLWLLYKKTIRLSESIKQGKPVYSLGSITRFAYAALAVIIALKFPDHFNLIGTICGLLTSTGVMLLDYFIMLITKRKQEER